MSVDWEVGLQLLAHKQTSNKMATKYKLLGGLHSEKTENGSSVIVRKGETFTSQHDDLHLKFGRDKFYPIGESTVVEQEQEEEPSQNTIDFNSMTVAELRTYAEDNEIDLEGATKKDDIILAIKVAEGIE